MVTLILGSADDEHAMHVGQRLHERGREVALLDSRGFPESLRLTYDPARNNGRIRYDDGSVLNLDEIASVYWRSYFGPIGPELPSAEQSFIAVNDARGLFESLLIRLPAKWVNGWKAYQSHQTKPAQLSLLAGHGVPVPDTLITNDPEAVREFAARHPRAIYKPVQGGAHTQRLSPKHLTDEHLATLRFAPLTLQEEVPGTSVRVFVAGERVLACALQTESLDYREDQQAKIVPHTLPAEVAAMCLTAARTLDLVWTGIDLQRTAEGRYVLLEANPSPMFLEFEARSGLPLTEALLDVLQR